MRRNSNSGVPEKRDSEDKPKRNTEDQENKISKAEAKIKDPIRCPLCRSVLMCPRSKDPEEFMEQKNQKCLTSSDPICINAIKSPSNAIYLSRIRKTT